MANGLFTDTRVQTIGGILIVVIAVIIGLTQFKFKPMETSTSQSSAYKFPGQLPDADINVNVRLTTNRGDIVLALDPAQAPLATSNFVYLVKEKFYDGIVWHRVEDWVVQIGDPQTKDAQVPRSQWGTGGPGYTIPDEPVTGDYTVGTLAMARTMAPNSAGSQIFVIKRDTPLDKTYAIFGRVAEGMEIVNALTVGDKIETAVIEPKS
jgi:peptidyl-prolyl cis-trans isomerase B (cyclophilin B)